MTASLFANLMDGKSQRYSVYHVWKIYTIIRQKGSVGRKELAHSLGLGEGTIRTIMEKMKEDESITCTRRGASLTYEGMRRLDSLGIEVKPLEMYGLTIDTCNCAALAKGMAFRVKDGCEQRDEAVKAGASGATTLVKQKGKIVFPNDGNYPDLRTSDELNHLFRICDGDALVIGTGSSSDLAEKAAVIATLKLHAPSINCWSEDGLLSESMDRGDMKCLALAIHELVGNMPFAIRTRDQLGILCEEGMIVSDRYTGPYLEEALRTGKTVRVVPTTGFYTGVPVICVPILKDGRAVVVMGLVDSTKLSIHDIMGRVRREGLPPIIT